MEGASGALLGFAAAEEPASRWDWQALTRLALAASRSTAERAATTDALALRFLEVASGSAVGRAEAASRTSRDSEREVSKSGESATASQLCTTLSVGLE